MVKIPRSTTAVGSNADAAMSRTVAGVDTTTSGITGGPLAGAGENTREGLVTGEAGGPAKDPAVAGVSASQTIETPTREADAAAAAASALLDGRPQDASRAAEAATGSALNAPGVGSGPASEPLPSARQGLADRFETLTDLEQIDLTPNGDRVVLIDLARGAGGVVVGGPAVEVGAGAGLPPARMSSEGSFGGDPEADRRAIEGGPALRPTGYKRAAPLPQDRTNIPELIEQGFDLIVTSKHDGFRRAGVAHSATATLRRSEDFTPAELQGMDADPMLVVMALR